MTSISSILTSTCWARTTKTAGRKFAAYLAGLPAKRRAGGARFAQHHRTRRHSAAIEADTVSVGAGSSRRRTAANTGKAGAIHRGGFFAGKPAPTGIASGLTGVGHKICRGEHLATLMPLRCALGQRRSRREITSVTAAVMASAAIGFSLTNEDTVSTASP